MTVRPHDLGGRKGFGAVPVEPDEPVFHGRWEGSVIAGILATIMAGLYNVDQFRAGIDDLDPLAYMSMGYYRRWLHTLEVNCVAAGVFAPEEVEERLALIAERKAPPAADSDGAGIAAALRQLVERGATNARPLAAAPAFAAGARVRARAMPGARHARVPGYVQGAVGTVALVHDAFVFPDTNLTGEGENPQYVYSVRFPAGELWDDAEPNTAVLVDLWEPYLEPAGGAA